MKAYVAGIAFGLLLIFLGFVIYEQAHIISAQNQLIQDLTKYIVLGCPTNN